MVKALVQTSRAPRSSTLPEITPLLAVLDTTPGSSQQDLSQALVLSDSGVEAMTRTAIRLGQVEVRLVGRTRRYWRRRPAAGLDLADPQVRDAVQRIYHARYARTVSEAGIDLNDGLQEVYCTLLRRNRGRSVYDPSRGALSTYVYQVCRSAVSGLIDKHRRMLRRDGGVGLDMDAALIEPGQR